MSSLHHWATKPPHHHKHNCNTIKFNNQHSNTSLKAIPSHLLRFSICDLAYLSNLNFNNKISLLAIQVRFRHSNNFPTRLTSPYCKLDTDVFFDKHTFKVPMYRKINTKDIFSFTIKSFQLRKSGFNYWYYKASGTAWGNPFKAFLSTWSAITTSQIKHSEQHMSINKSISYAKRGSHTVHYCRQWKEHDKMII